MNIKMKIIFTSSSQKIISSNNIALLLDLRTNCTDSSKNNENYGFQYFSYPKVFTYIIPSNVNP